MPEEDLVDIDAPLNEGDEYSPDHYWAELAYCEFEAFLDQMKHDAYMIHHYGHEDGPEAYAAECYAEELLEQELAEQQDYEHFLSLNPIKAFEEQKTFEMEVMGMYPDSYDRYEYMDLIGQEYVDDACPLPKSEDECQY